MIKSRPTRLVERGKTEVRYRNELREFQRGGGVEAGRGGGSWAWRLLGYGAGSVLHSGLEVVRAP